MVGLRAEHEIFLSFRSGSHYCRTWRGWRLRGREPKQHTALPRKTKTTATPPEQEQQGCRSRSSSVGDAQLSSRFSSLSSSSRGQHHRLDIRSLGDELLQFFSSHTAAPPPPPDEVDTYRRVVRCPGGPSVLGAPDWSTVSALPRRPVAVTATATPTWT
jgi:hypothetical protein